MNVRTTLLALVIRATLGLSLTAGSSQDTLRVDVQLVNVVATVTDQDGRYVSGLTADDFIVEDEGIPQEIVHFTQDSDIPLSIGIVLDTSGSMMQRMRTAVVAVDRFMGTLHENDDVFFITFADRVSLIQDLTNDRERLSRALTRARAMGGTALYDAVSASIEKVREGRHDKRAILLLTDGSDTASELGLGDTLDAVQGAEVLVYGLGIDPVRFADPDEHVQFDLPIRLIPGAPPLRRPRSTEDPVDMKVLEDFARASGGKAYLVSGTWTGGTAEEIDVVLDEVSAELRNQYSLGYYPSVRGDGRFHSIKVHVRDRDYLIRARNGYLAP